MPLVRLIGQRTDHVAEFLELLRSPDKDVDRMHDAESGMSQLMEGDKVGTSQKSSNSNPPVGVPQASQSSAAAETGEHLTRASEQILSMKSPYINVAVSSWLISANAEPDSDIDLIIVSSAFRGMPVWKRWGILGDALSEVLQPLEALVYSPEEFESKKNWPASFLGHILRQPEVVAVRLQA